jgi:hypothetical protein
MADTTLSDPLGRDITLHDRTWYGHVVKGHPDIMNHRDLVEAAVRSPDEIRHSKSDPDCRIYYGRGPSPTLRMMVVVDVAVRVVKTAHLAKKTTGGEVEWSR